LNWAQINPDGLLLGPSQPLRLRHTCRGWGLQGSTPAGTTWTYLPFDTGGRGMRTCPAAMRQHTGRHYCCIICSCCRTPGSQGAAGQAVRWDPNLFNDYSNTYTHVIRGSAHQEPKKCINGQQHSGRPIHRKAPPVEIATVKAAKSAAIPAPRPPSPDFLRIGGAMALWQATEHAITVFRHQNKIQWPQKALTNDPTTVPSFMACTWTCAAGRRSRLLLSWDNDFESVCHDGLPAPARPFDCDSL
jgi:hypothetical protein